MLLFPLTDNNIQKHNLSNDKGKSAHNPSNIVCNDKVTHSDYIVFLHTRF